MKNSISQGLRTLVLIFSMALSQNLFAQDGDAGAGGENMIGDSLMDLSIVGACGIGGAVLGLSTLSFVEEPSDHLKNIAVGGAVGIVLGVGIVLFNQATKSHGSLNSAQLAPKLDPIAEWNRDYSRALVKTSSPSQFSYSFQF